MPNRIIKESICTSENVDQLSTFQETFFYRLLVNCDDYGRMDARIKILSSRLFPLKDIRSNQIEDALRALSSADLIILYEVDGKPFLQMKTWDKHQQVRAKRSKYPSPDESNCNQMISDDIKCLRNPIQSESKSNPNQNICDESSSPPAAQIPMNDGSQFDVTEDFVSELERLYPAVDVRQELRNMVGWCIGNPTRRKTKSGVKKFITSWLSREQDKGGRNQNSQPKIKTVTAQQYEQRSYEDEDAEAMRRMMELPDTEEGMHDYFMKRRGVV